MPVSVECEQCQAHYLIDDKFAGKRAKCKKCGHVMAIPLPGGGGGEAASLSDDTADSGGGAGALAAEAAPWGTPIKAGPAKNWRPEEVVVERDEDVTDIPVEQSHGYDASYSPSVGPIVPTLIGLYVVAVLGLAIRDQVTLPEQSVVHSLPVWAGAILKLVTFFLVIGPMAMGGFILASRIRGFRLARPTYIRATAVAALPLTLVSVLGLLSALDLDNELVFLLLILGVAGLTFQAVRAIFYLEAVSGLVATGCALVTGMIGFGISMWLTTLVLGFVPQPPERPPVVFKSDTSGKSGGGESVGTTKSEDPEAGTTRPAPGVADLRETSAARLGSIAAAIQRHFAQAQGAWPATLDELVSGGALPAEDIRSPFAADGDAAGYLYGASPKPFATAAEVVVAYDDAELRHASETPGTTVLFGDLSVRWMARAEFDRAFARSQEVVAEVQAANRAVAATPTPVVPGDPRPGEGAPKAPDPVPGADAAAAAQARQEQANVAAARVRDRLGPVARQVDAVPLPAGFVGVIGTRVPSPTFAVVSRPDREQEQVEIWTGDPPARKGEPALFKVDASSRPNYAVAPDGGRFVRIGTFPRLSARVRTPGSSRDTAVLDLDRAAGAPSLLGFLDDDRFLVRWEKGALDGLEVLNAKTGRSMRRVELANHEPSAPNEAVSPDGKWFAHAVREGGANLVVLHPLTGGKPRKLALTALDAQWPIRPAGIAFSPDGAKIAALFVHQGEGLIVVWQVLRAGGKASGEIIVPVPVQAIQAPNGQPARSLDWVAGGKALLVCGTVILDAVGGELLAELGATDVVSQSVGEGNAFRVVSAKGNDRAGAVALVVVDLDPAQLATPEADANAKPKAGAKANPKRARD